MNGNLAPKDLGGILGETFNIYKNNFLRLIAIVAVVQLPIVILYGIYISMTPMSAYGRLDTPDFSPAVFLLSIPIGLAMFAASICMIGAVIHAVSEQYFKQPVSIGRAYGFAWHRLGAMFGAVVLVYLALAGIYLAAILISVIMAAVIGGSSGWLIAVAVIGIMVLIVIPAIIYVGTNWSFMLQTALLERCGPTSALSRSWTLVRGSWWRVLGITLLLLLILQVIGIIFAMPGMMGYLSEIMSDIINETPGGFTPYGASEFSIWMIWLVIGAAIGNIISLPIFVIGQTLLYFDLRVRKQGYSLDALANELGMASPSVDTASTSPPV